MEQLATKPYRSVWHYIYKTPHRLDYVSAGGIRTRYLEAGDPTKPVVILLHGTAGSVENFCANIAPYAEHFHVYAIDMLGCGWTDKPDYPYVVPLYAKHVRDFMDVMGIEKASFVGVSLGSWVAVRVAHDFPGRAHRIVMIAPAGIIPNRQAFDDYVAGTRARRKAAAGGPTWENVKAIFTYLLLDERDVIDDLIAVRLDIYQNPELQKVMPHLLEQTKGEFSLTEDEWRALPNEILAIKAVDKNDMFLLHADKIAEFAPNARKLEMRNCDHWAQFEAADVFNPVSIEFLANGHTTAKS